jgi:hypothetical protein
MDSTLAFRVGLLLGEFMNRGVEAKPIIDGEGNYTDVIEVRLDEPFSHVILRLKVSTDG